jgi:hypothetical protein
MFHDLARQFALRGQCDQDACPAVQRQAGLLSGGRAVRRENCHSACLENPKEGNHSLGQVGQQQHYPVAFFQAKAQQRLAKAVRLLVDLPVSQAQPLEFYGGLEREASGG